MPLGILIFIVLIFLCVLAWRKIGTSKRLDNFIESCIEPEQPKKDSSDFEKQGQKLFNEMTDAEREAERKKVELEAEAEKLKATKDSVFFNEKEEAKEEK